LPSYHEVHNHGTEDGPGLSCREINLDGILYGSCKPFEVLSADPGETTGWAYQDQRDDYPGGILDLGQIEGLKALALFLEAWNLETRPVKVCVIEYYKVWSGPRGSKANVGSELETVRAIGVLESWCIRNGIRIHKYYSERDFLMLQAKQCGLNPKAAAHRNTHWAYAANHGRYYLQQIGLAKSALKRAMMKK
jgi:hypothetical protein